jgi:hypothetical protein
MRREFVGLERAAPEYGAPIAVQGSRRENIIGELSAEEKGIAGIPRA